MRTGAVWFVLKSYVPIRLSHAVEAAVGFVLQVRMQGWMLAKRLTQIAEVLHVQTGALDKRLGCIPIDLGSIGERAHSTARPKYERNGPVGHSNGIMQQCMKHPLGPL